MSNDKNTPPEHLQEGMRPQKAQKSWRPTAAAPTPPQAPPKPTDAAPAASPPPKEQ